MSVMAYLVLGLPGFILAVLLLAQGETVQGRVVALAVMLLYPAPVLYWLGGFVRRRRPVSVASLCLVMLALIMFAGCYFATPDGWAERGASVRSVYSASMPYRRASIANLVPEIDQLKLGSYLFPLIDPLIDKDRAVRIRRLFMTVYRDMGQSAEFTRLGSMMSYVYLDMFSDSRPAGHFYQYIPKTAKKDSKLPVILFLHGSLGNFKGYLWVWKKFADEHGYAIVAPSFGQGNWYLNGGPDAIEQVRQYCSRHPQMDGRRIYLAGLSNGGTGVTRAIVAGGKDYAGFIFISPVIEEDIAGTSQFAAQCAGRRVLVLYGAEDERIPASYVERGIKLMTAHEISVQSKSYPEEDHFLFFSKPDQVCRDVAAWLDESYRQETIGP